MSVARLHDGLHLRAIDVKRYRKLHRLVLFVYASGIDRLSRTLLVVAVDEGCHDDILPQLVGIGVDVIPHYELIKGEKPQQRLLDDVPPLLVDDGLTEIGEYQFHIDA